MVISRSNSLQKSWILPKAPETRRKLPRRLRGALQVPVSAAGAYRRYTRRRTRASRRSAMCKLDETIYIPVFTAAPQSGGAYVFSCKPIRHNSTFVRNFFASVAFTFSPLYKKRPRRFHAVAVLMYFCKRARYPSSAPSACASGR